MIKEPHMASEYLGNWIDTIATVATHQEALKKWAPELFSQAQLVHIDEERLLIAVPNSSLATRIYLHAPEILEFVKTQLGIYVEQVRTVTQEHR